MHGALVLVIVLLPLCACAASTNSGRDDSVELFTVIGNDDSQLETHGVLARIVGGRTATNLTNQGKAKIVASSSVASKEGQPGSKSSAGSKDEAVLKAGEDQVRRNDTRDSPGRWQDQTRRNETWKQDRRSTDPNRTTSSSGKPGGTIPDPPRVLRAPPARSDSTNSGNKPQGSAATGVIRPEDDRTHVSSGNKGSPQSGRNNTRYNHPRDPSRPVLNPESSEGVNSHGGTISTSYGPILSSDGVLRPSPTSGSSRPSNTISDQAVGTGGSGPPSSSGTHPGEKNDGRFDQNDGVTSHGRPNQYGGSSSGPSISEVISPHRGHTDRGFKPEQAHAHEPVRPHGSGSGYSPVTNSANHPASPTDHRDTFGTGSNDGRALPNPDLNRHQHPHYNGPSVHGQDLSGSGAAIPSIDVNPLRPPTSPSGRDFNVPLGNGRVAPGHPGVGGVVIGGAVPGFPGHVNTGGIHGQSSQPGFGAINPQMFGLPGVSPGIAGIEKAVAETADAIRKAAQGPSVGFGGIDLDVAESRLPPFIYGR